MPEGVGAEEVYRGGRESVLLSDLSARGRIALTGAARQSLLHRITTNDIKGLAPGSGAATLLVTGKGRILHRLTVLCLTDRLVLLTSAEDGTRVAETIRKYVVFDDVQVEDAGERTFLLGLHGPQALSLARAVRGVAEGTGAGGAPEGVLERFQPLEVSIASHPVTLVAEPGFHGDGVLILGEASVAGEVRDALRAAGARLGLVEADPREHAAAWEALRIESGLASAGSELSEDWNPLEMRQEDALSFDKGCYVGQEVIARLRTYDRVKRQLVRLEIDGPEEVEPGSELRLGASPAATGPEPTDGETGGSAARGVITSAALPPGGDRIVALGVITTDSEVVRAIGRPGDTGPDPLRVTVLTSAGSRSGVITGAPATAVDVRVEPPKPGGLARGRFRS